MLFITLPSGARVRLPHVGETVTVRFPEKPEWNDLPALVTGVPSPVNDRIGLDLVIFNKNTLPTKVHFRAAVPYDYPGFEEGTAPLWRHIPTG